MNSDEIINKINECLGKADELVKGNFFTEAFLIKYFLSEHIAKEIIHSTKVEERQTDLFKILKKTFAKNEIDTHKFDKLKKATKKFVEEVTKKEKSIYVSNLIKSLKKKIPDIDELKIKKFIGTSYPDPKDSTKTISSTIRNKRNNIVHNASTIDEEYYNKTSTLFTYFFNIITQYLNELG